MEGLLTDLRLGFRALLHRQKTSWLALTALGVALGAAGAVFSLVDGVLLRPLPFPATDRLVALWQIRRDDPTTWLQTSATNFAEWQRLATRVTHVASASNASRTLTSFEDGETPLMRQVSYGYFETLGVAPALGRSFRAEEDVAGGPKVAILSDALWRQRFGADPAVLGKTTQLDGVPHEIVGVMPPGFDNPVFLAGDKPWAWFPYAAPQSGLERQSNTRLVVARLAPGVSIEEAQEEMDAIADVLADQYPETHREQAVVVAPLAERLIRPARPGLLVVFGAVLLVVAVALSNIANLLLARALRREKEITVRRALGAGPSRLARQLVIENLLFAWTAGALGFLVMSWASGALTSMLPPTLSWKLGLGVDGRGLFFLFGLSTLLGLILGLATTGQLLSRGSGGGALAGNRITASPQQRRLRQLLVAGELALSLGLLISAGLLLRSYQRFASLHPGFNAKQVLTFRLSTRGPAYTEGARRAAFFDEVLARLRELPGVRSAGFTQAAPFLPQFVVLPLEVEGRPPAAPGAEPQAAVRRVSAGYLEAMEIPLLSGRTLLSNDSETSPPVVWVSRTLAEQLWPGQDPLDESLTLLDRSAPNGASRPRRVVGVVGDVRSASLPAVPAPTVYLPFVQDPQTPSVSFVLRTAAAPMTLLEAARHEVRQVDRSMPIYQPQTLEQTLADLDWAPRLLARILSIFAVLALVLAASGIYSVLSFGVAERRREIGIRMALGATAGNVQVMMVRQTLLPTGLGIAAGLLAALVAARALAGQLYQVSPWDPTIYSSLTALLVLVSCFAGYWPARQAAAVNPATTLEES